ncbi:MAG: hypothetical protein LIP12_00325 [Clostridiales bacterium]|nr:hypothetical protein [Clostridiales bacterium]
MEAKDFLHLFIDKTRPNLLVREVDARRNSDCRTLYEVYTKDEPTFTDIVNKAIIHDIVSRLLDEYLRDGYTKGIQHEYFRIDTVGWVAKYLDIDAETAKRTGLNRHLWDLKIAVEHENSKWDWSDEAIKLLHVRCPLKVIISYNYCDCRDTGEYSDCSRLYHIAEWMEMMEAFRNSKDNHEEYLVIIGNGEGILKGADRNWMNSSRN